MKGFAPVFVCVVLLLSCASERPRVEKSVPTDYVCLDCEAISHKAGKCPLCDNEMVPAEKITVCPVCTMPVKGACPYCHVEGVPGLAECVCDACGKSSTSCECPPSAEKPGETTKFSCPRCGGDVKFTSPTECTCPKCNENFPSHECMPPCGKCKSCGGSMRMMTHPMRFKCPQCGLMSASKAACPDCGKMMQEIEIKKVPEMQPAEEKK